MLGLWLLMTVILANLYMSTITSFMTVVKLEPIPNSLEELTFNYDESGKECLVYGGPQLPNFLSFQKRDFDIIIKKIIIIIIFFYDYPQNILSL